MSSNHYLFVMWDGGGTIPPELGVARRLIARGHRVTVLSEQTMADEAAAAGCEFIEYQHAFSRRSRRPEDDPLRDFEKRTPIGMLQGARDILMCGRAVDFSRDVRAAVEVNDFDAIVVDAFLLGALPGALSTGLPVATLNPGPEMRPAPGRPPGGMGLKPSDGRLAELRNRLMKAMFMTMFKAGAAPINAARQEWGLEPIAHPFDQWLHVDRYLMLTSAHFDFPAHEYPDNFAYVGAQLDDPSWSHQWTPPAGDEPLVLVSLGSTFQNQRSKFEAAMDAFRGLSVRGLVTLGNVFEVGQFSPPDNVDLVASAPHNEVLPHTRAAVVHGGHGTVMKTLAAGRPMVVVPLGRDQFDNGARVEVAGAGIMVKKQSAQHIRAALREVLEDPSYRNAAEALGAQLREEFAADRAISHLEELVSRAMRESHARAS